MLDQLAFKNVSYSQTLDKKQILIIIALIHIP